MSNIEIPQQVIKTKSLALYTYQHFRKENRDRGEFVRGNVRPNKTSTFSSILYTHFPCSRYHVILQYIEGPFSAWTEKGAPDKGKTPLQPGTVVIVASLLVALHPR